jgi:diaminohydroxyphosphoribosylaminopyrimidine deaminase/5-amino-6-(5-phosphoribosylamino)uracil reductase
LCFNLIRNEKRENVEWVKLDANGFLETLLKNLVQRNIGSVIVEGGAKTLNAFLEGGWWHELRVFTSQNALGGGLAAPVAQGMVIHEDYSSGDRLKIWVNPDRIKNEG